MAPKPTGVDDAPGLTPDGLIRDPGDPVETTRLGITLRGLRRLRRRLEDHFGGPEAFRSVSTADVNFKWVRPVTADRACRLLEAREEVAAEDVAPPAYFISHAWKNSLALLLDYLDSFLAAAADTIAVWIDILAVNQHEKTQQQKHDIGAFSDVVAACGAGTIVVLDIANCNPSTRGWCIFEWAHTLSAHGPDGLHVALTPADRAVVVNTLDVTKAECQFPADKDMILQVVSRQHGSTDTFNHKLRLQLLLEPLSYNVDMRRLLRRAAAAGTCWAFSPVAEWLAEPRATAPRVLCVAAGAGEGKSTISAALCAAAAASQSETAAATATAAAQELPPLPQLPAGGVSAYHFLKYNDQRRLDPVNIIKSLAFQLAMRIPSVRDNLLGQDAAQVAQLTDAGKAFKQLLLQPLKQHEEALQAAKSAAEARAQKAAKEAADAKATAAAAAAKAQAAKATAAEVAAVLRSEAGGGDAGGGDGGSGGGAVGVEAAANAAASTEAGAAAAAAAAEVAAASAATEAAAAAQAFEKLHLVLLLDALDEADPLSEQLQLQREQAAQLQPSRPQGTAAATAAAAVPQAGGANRPSGSGATAVPAAAATATSAPAPVYPTACSNSALQLLTGWLRRLPTWVRFVVTTRPDAASGQVLPSLERTFKPHGGVRLLRPHQLVAAPASTSRGGGDSSSESDAAGGQGSSTAAKDAASAQDSGGTVPDGGSGGGGGSVMVYATVAAGCLPPGSPAASLAAPSLPDLYRLYGSIFDDAWRRLESDAVRREVQDLLGVVLAAQEPLSHSLLQQMGLGHVIPSLPGYPHLFYVDEHHLYTIHKSLADWMAGGSINAGGGGAQVVAATDEGTAAVATEQAQQEHFARPDVLAAHLRLGTALAAARHTAAAAPPYLIKYLIHHLAAAAGSDAAGSINGEPSPSGGAVGDGPERVPAGVDLAAALLDEVLADFKFLELALARSRGPAIAESLGSMRRHTALSNDVLRWLSAHMQALQANPKSALESAQANCPLTSRLYRAAVAAAGTPWVPRLVVPFRPPASDWPAMTARLRDPVHPDCTVRAVAWSPDCRQVAVGGLLADVQVYDSVTCRLLATMEGHMECIQALDWSRDGRLIMSGAQDKTVRWFDVVTGQCVGAKAGHTGYVEAVAFHPTSTACASACNRGVVLVWEQPAVATTPGTQTQFKQLLGARGGCTDLAFSPDGAMLAAAHAAGVHVYSGRPPYERLRVLMYNMSPAQYSGLGFSQDSRFVAVARLHDDTVHVLDTKRSWHDVAHLTGRTKPGSYVAFSGSSTKVAAGDDTGVVYVYDIAQLYDFPPDGSNPLKSDPASLASLPSPPMSSLARADSPVDSGPPSVAASSPRSSCDGEEPPAPALPPEPITMPPMTTFHEHKRDEGTWRLLWLPVPGTEILASCGRDGTACAYDMALLPGDGLAGVVSYEGGLEVPPPARSYLHDKAHQPYMTALGVSPDGCWVATCASDNHVVITRTGTWERAAVLPAGREVLVSAAWSPDGRWLACGNAKDELRIFGVKDGGACWAEMRMLRGHRCLFWQLPNRGPLVLAAACLDRTIRMYHVSASPHASPAGWEQLPQTLGSPELFPGYISCMAASPDSSVLAVGVFGFAVHFFDGAEPYAHRGSVSLYGKEPMSAAMDDLAWLPPASGSSSSSGGTGSAGPGGSGASAAAAVRLRLAATGNFDEAFVFEMLTEDEAREQQQQDQAPAQELARATADTGEGEHGIAAPRAESAAKVAPPPPPKPTAPPPVVMRQQFEVKGHSAGVSALAVSPDSRWIATGSRDKSIRLWDAGTGQQVGVTLSGLHDGWVLGLRFAPDGSALYSISHDGKLGVLVPAARLLQAAQLPE
ncbi:hypothetical protein HXX76_012195 [Chlamydomonas incerta]|uniref:Nephrocystin 3-like N-terminal domain-containing protein n=1 Tax=Chlamydomonas incerta TaxID=51695 RepID=A0A835SW34_CHLIN|nr:hypothetical protein HXX76_012195 [Chlamydomonas incerta]|eukprot:KAG2427875.1 hypothetical protein HXX76_012195 [Chlamydomonas incerta]